MNKITAIVNTYNEAENIQSCLESINWADEIIIVDTGSIDKTINIAKKYTKKIFHFPFKGYVETARNFSLTRASGNWIMVLDADERLTSNAKNIIEKLVRDKIIDAFSFPRRNYINQKKYLRHGYFYPDYQIRLFKNNKKIKYSGVIHEQPSIQKNKLRKISSLEILHNASHSKYDSFFSFRRFFPYIKIEGNYLFLSNRSNAQFFLEGLKQIPLHIYRSFIKEKGYKDGYSGLRAAILYASYKGAVYFYAIKLRFEKI